MRSVARPVGSLGLRMARSKGIGVPGAESPGGGASGAGPADST
jgi:hypothetical protein